MMTMHPVLTAALAREHDLALLAEAGQRRQRAEAARARARAGHAGTSAAPARRPAWTRAPRWLTSSR